MPNELCGAMQVVPRRGIEVGEYAQQTIAHKKYMRRLYVSDRRKRGRPGIRTQHTESASTRFVCKTCGVECSSPEDLGAHWRAEHPEIFSEAWLQPGRGWRRGVRNHGRENGRKRNAGRR